MINATDINPKDPELLEVFNLLCDTCREGSGHCAASILAWHRNKTEKLREDQKLLNALEEAGVDNWEGYDLALGLLNEGQA